MSHSFLHGVIATAVATTITLQSLPLRAQETCAQASSPVLANMAHAMPLIPGIVEQPTRKGGIFFQKNITVHVKQGQRVWLHPAPGNAMLATDDIIKIQAMPSGKVWKYDYRDPGYTRIVPVTKSHEITALFVEGDNTLTIKLIDMLRPVYSSRPYWLVIENTLCTTLAAAPVAPTATETPPPSPTPSPPPTATSTVTPTATPMPTATTAATATPTASATAIAQPAAPQRLEEVSRSATPTVTPTPSRRTAPPLGQTVILAIVAFFVIRKAWSARPRRR